MQSGYLSTIFSEFVGATVIAVGLQATTLKPQETVYEQKKRENSSYIL